MASPIRHGSPLALLRQFLLIVVLSLCIISVAGRETFERDRSELSTRSLPSALARQGFGRFQIMADAGAFQPMASLHFASIMKRLLRGPDAIDLNDRQQFPNGMVLQLGMEGYQEMDRAYEAFKKANPNFYPKRPRTLTVFVTKDYAVWSSSITSSRPAWQKYDRNLAPALALSKCTMGYTRTHLHGTQCAEISAMYEYFKQVAIVSGRINPDEKVPPGSRIITVREKNEQGELEVVEGCFPRGWKTGQTFGCREFLKRLAVEDLGVTDPKVQPIPVPQDWIPELGATCVLPERKGPQ